MEGILVADEQTLDPVPDLRGVLASTIWEMPLSPSMSFTARRFL
jgi:hypothetical protein